MYRPFVSQPVSPNHCNGKPSTPKKPKKQTRSGPNVEKKDLVHDDEVGIDFSKVPPPFCSCSGFARRCYKAGPGGWQSACCTYSLSEYPLPFKARKPGKRVTGRKMCGGPYRKLLCALAKEGADLGRPVDLKDHWAKIGTNKFVTFK
ncbi:protein basic pentacysteine7 [Phtheirospermum japonicum]|uniref:GAGA-binding transcriptional activator n=1 Tax=Phtheirospermum japonicum TaxID=374723 RepID=A0A830AY21_9LAMI|nr:protein basic pentacysteine7 [Phtheirospermum japonicum]